MLNNNTTELFNIFKYHLSWGWQNQGGWDGWDM